MKLRIGLFVAVDMLIVLTVLVFVFRGGQQGEAAADPESVARQTPTAAERERFLTAYRIAHRTGDVDAAMQLICGDNAEDDALPVLRESLASDFQTPLASVDIVPLDEDEMLDYTVHGVRYVPNLTPVGKLLITLAGDKDATLTTSYLVGVKNGRYQIATSMAAN